MTFADLITLLRLRTRTPGDTTYRSPTDAWLLALYGYIQRFYNAGAQAIIENASFTTTANAVVHTLPSEAISPVAIYDSYSRPLKRVDWHELRASDNGWFRRVGKAFEVYAPIGAKLFALYPALPSASSVTIFYSKLTAIPTLDTDPLSLPDVEVPFLIDLAELIILLRSREFGEMKPKVESFTNRLRLMGAIR